MTTPTGTVQPGVYQRRNLFVKRILHENRISEPKTLVRLCSRRMEGTERWISGPKRQRLRQLNYWYAIGYEGKRGRGLVPGHTPIGANFLINSGMEQ